MGGVIKIKTTQVMIRIPDRLLKIIDDHAQAEMRSR